MAVKNKESKSESFIPLEVQCNILLHPRVRRSLSLFTGFTSRGVCWPPLLFAIVSFCGRLGWFVLPTWRLFSTPSVGMEGKCRSLLGRPPPMLSFGPWRVVMEHPHSTAPPPPSGDFVPRLYSVMQSQRLTPGCRAHCRCRRLLSHLPHVVLPLDSLGHWF